MKPGPGADPLPGATAAVVVAAHAGFPPAGMSC
jgi:hypothetical protein